MVDSIKNTTERVPNYLENTAQRVPCMLVLDASASMNEKDPASGRPRIDLLNDGIKAFHDELQTDEIALCRVQIAAVTAGGFGNEARVILDWTDGLDFIPFKLKAGSGTPLGAGALLALDKIEQHKVALRSNGIPYYRPWMFIMTDGVPTDDAGTWARACRTAREHESGRKVQIYPVGVGQANLAKLGELSTTPALQMNGMKFREFFKWVSDSMSTLARSVPGARIDLPSTNPWAAVRLD
jgi:uncharacterized protein YegL